MKKKREKLAGGELGVDVNSEVNSRSTPAEFSQFYNFWKKWKKWKNELELTSELRSAPTKVLHSGGEISNYHCSIIAVPLDQWYHCSVIDSLILNGTLNGTIEYHCVNDHWFNDTQWYIEWYHWVSSFNDGIIDLHQGHWAHSKPASEMASVAPILILMLAINSTYQLAPKKTCSMPIWLQVFLYSDIGFLKGPCKNYSF